MGELVLQLIPVALGIVLSPLAIMALVAILVSRLARVNGVAFLIGWAAGVIAVLLLGLWIFAALDVQAPQKPPVWVDLLRIAIALFLLGAAVWVYRKGHAHVKAMAVATTPQAVVAAAPQLPGWLQTVSTFRPGRSAALGLGIFVLNPVDASCALLAALDLTLAGLDTAPLVGVVAVFWVVSVLPIAIPVIYVLVRGAAAQPSLDRLRDWVATHTNVLNAALLLVIAVLQLQKGISALL
ncbi:GAP family protein [Microbacterium sp. W1N]|uniref:GAP family protein n=1 Tax=Microbacterium festucae TaxID=2977531 RepID=UPI0021C1EB7A|nr:GAP family protein [Microbacterium festucae]MCT9819220.1 GAP family protein [Microbacterium festucae]